MTARPYDLIVFGATSFVGQILCRYLLDMPDTTSRNRVRWAMAGRSGAKLEALKTALGAAASPVALFQADAGNEDQLRALCRQTRVMVSTVGPYALYGEPLVKVCAESGTDYCDLTGEAPWIRQMIDRYETTAQASGARIVHSCGFDSIPSDLGVWFLEQQALQRLGAPCPQVKMRVKALRGAASGGTVASMMKLVEDAVADPAIRKMLSNPYLLCPPDAHRRARQPEVKGAVYDQDLQAWSAPFIMAAINTRIVQRTQALLAGTYGEPFLYDEAMLTGDGLKGRLAAVGLTAGLGGFAAASALAPSRWFLKRFVLPEPGEGPSPKAQEQGFFDLRFVGRAADGRELRVKVTGDRDPGYGSTATMLGQAAICLALDRSKQQQPGGFWTPAAMFGDALVERLRAYSGLTFEVLEA